MIPAHCPRICFSPFFSDFSRFLSVFGKNISNSRFFSSGFGQEPDICRRRGKVETACMTPAHCPRTFFVPFSISQVVFGFGQNAANLGVCKNPTLTGSLSETKMVSESETPSKLLKAAAYSFRSNCPDGNLKGDLPILSWLTSSILP